MLLYGNDAPLKSSNREEHDKTNLCLRGWLP